jgi:hypothetical protein
VVDLHSMLCQSPLVELGAASRGSRLVSVIVIGWGGQDVFLSALVLVQEHVRFRLMHCDCSVPLRWKIHRLLPRQVVWYQSLLVPQTDCVLLSYHGQEHCLHYDHVVSSVRLAIQLSPKHGPLSAVGTSWN